MLTRIVIVNLFSGSLLCGCAVGQCTPYQIQWFGCDCCHDNDCNALRLDGGPICGSGNCSRPPDQCWNQESTSRSRSGGDIRWEISGSDNSGSIDISHARDYVVRGRTYLYSDADRTIHLSLSGDTIKVWFNGVGQCVGEWDLDLHAGRNSFAWIASNQNQGNVVAIRLPTVPGVYACHEQFNCPADFNGDGFVDQFDYLGYVTAFETGGSGADMNGDGFLDFFDYDEYLRLFELGC